jgi:hypothetical protein
MFYRPPAAVCAAAIALFAGLPISAHAAEETVAVPRSEWEALKREMAQMHRELKDLKAARPTPLAVPLEQGNVANAAPAQRGLKAPLESLSKSLTELVAPGRPGSNAITIKGEAAGNWRWEDLNKAGGFDAFFSPEFHWQMTDRLSFDAKVDFGLNRYTNYLTGAEQGGDVVLDLAHLNWQVADQFTLILGKFRSPMNAYAERYDYAYINPLPDAPLGLINEILPKSNVGVQLCGEFPLPYAGGAVTASVFAGNAPRLEGLHYSGSIDFPDRIIGRDNYAVGGRLGWQVCPHLELGYGLEYAQGTYDPGYYYALDFPTNDVFLHSIDLATSVDALRGRWTLQAQYGWSELNEDAFKRHDEPGESSYAASTHHHAGYVQLSYRGREWGSDLLNRLEFIVRGDRHYFSGYQQSTFDYDYTQERYVRQIFNISRQEANRLTLGLDYWITDYTVLKAAYEYLGGNTYYGARTDFSPGSSVILGFATGL